MAQPQAEGFRNPRNQNPTEAHDVNFYRIHCAGNIIAPDPEADRWQRHIIEAVNSAEEMGCQLILTLGR